MLTVAQQVIRLQKQNSRLEDANKTLIKDRDSWRDKCVHLNVWVDGGAWVWANDETDDPDSMSSAATVVMSGEQFRTLLRCRYDRYKK